MRELRRFFISLWHN